MLLGNTRSATTLRLGLLSFAVVLYFLLWGQGSSLYSHSQRNTTSAPTTPRPQEPLLEDSKPAAPITTPSSVHGVAASSAVGAASSAAPAAASGSTPSSTSSLAPADTPAPDAHHDSHDEFWKKLLRTLEDTEPKCDIIRHTYKGLNDTDKKHEPLRPTKPHPHNINMTDEVEQELMRAHYSMRRAAFRLAPEIPFEKDTTGVVVTSSPKQMPYLMASLRMLRSTGSKLPVELFLADKSEYNATLCEGVLKEMNVRCIIMNPIFATKIDHFQYKVFSILLSSFQNVLFLDSDAFPIHDPTPLFSTRPYTSHGLVVFPDIWGNTVSSHFYHIAGIPEVPVSARIASETGVIFFDKERHRESLLMTLYYNYFGPSHYYAIFSQGSAGPGDKDTFIQGAMAVDLPFYTVKTIMMGLGRTGGSGGPGFHMLGMSQRDPAQDFLYGPPMPNHIHKKDSWEEDDEASKEVDGPKVPRPMFMHQMVFKIRPGIILRPDLKSYRDENGAWQRMWSTDEDAVSIFEYDAEAVLWEVLQQLSCVEGVEPEACDKLKEYREAVFGVPR